MLILFWSLDYFWWLCLSLNPLVFIFVWPTWASQSRTVWATPTFWQPTYRMCLCIGYSQLHTSIKHAMYGEPYNCGESTERDLLRCLPGWHKLLVVLCGCWLTSQYGRKSKAWSSWWGLACNQMLFLASLSHLFIFSLPSFNNLTLSELRQILTGVVNRGEISTLHWMWLCVGYAQLHTCIKHETGEPYDCGEGAETHCASCLLTN